MASVASGIAWPSGWRSHIKDLRVIGKLTGLTALEIEAPIEDLGFIKQLKALERLDLSECTAARDIAPLASLKELKSLLLGGVPIESVKPIASLRQPSHRAADDVRHRNSRGCRGTTTTASSARPPREEFTGRREDEKGFDQKNL